MTLTQAQAPHTRPAPTLLPTEVEQKSGWEGFCGACVERGRQGRERGGRGQLTTPPPPPRPQLRRAPSQAALEAGGVAPRWVQPACHLPAVLVPCPVGPRPLMDRGQGPDLRSSLQAPSQPLILEQ